MRRLIFALVVLLAACRVKHKPWSYEGLPDGGAKAHCAWTGDGYHNEPGVCVAAGKAYSCVMDYDDRTVTCGPGSPPAPPPTPEAP